MEIVAVRQFNVINMRINYQVSFVFEEKIVVKSSNQEQNYPGGANVI